MLSGLFGHELTHVTLTFVAAAIGCIVAQTEKKKWRKHLYLLTTAGAIIGGFFVDIDHVFEYILAYGLRFDINLFFSGSMFNHLQKIYVLFHAWEWVILIGICALATRKLTVRYFLLGLMFGLMFHLLYDTIYNHIYFCGYSIIYRLVHNFDARFIALPSGM